jgi:hypothetical protein
MQFLALNSRWSLGHPNNGDSFHVEDYASLVLVLNISPCVAPYDGEKVVHMFKRFCHNSYS